MMNGAEGWRGHWEGALGGGIGRGHWVLLTRESKTDKVA